MLEVLSFFAFGIGLILQKLTVLTFFLAKKGAMKLSGLGSLSKDIFERRTPTGSVFFALFGSGFARNFEKSSV